ncbi:MAG: helix-turn-helix transcriptional regulator, partial [Clostridia bacterium]|nr:helix-turn-helix transcriptional regulator [Clostridia bacterium]
DNTHFQTLYQHLKNLESVQFKKGVESFKTVANFYSICAILFPQVEIKESKLEVGKSIAPAISYIETNYATDISVEELSKLCYLSPSRFYFLFKKHTGYSPIVYKNHISIQHAAQELLLNQSISISTVAEKYGFSCTIYFTRLFKKMMGKSPLQYRKHGLRL